MLRAPASSTMSWPTIRREARPVRECTARLDELGAVTTSPLPHAVADAADRGDIPCGLGGLVELSSQIGDVHVDEMVVPDPGVAPDGLHQLAARECLARPTCQGHQQSSLRGGQWEDRKSTRLNSSHVS